MTMFPCLLWRIHLGIYDGRKPTISTRVEHQALIRAVSKLTSKPFGKLVNGLTSERTFRIDEFLKSLCPIKISITPLYPHIILWTDGDSLLCFVVEADSSGFSQNSVVCEGHISCYSISCVGILNQNLVFHWIYGHEASWAWYNGNY